MGPFKAPVPFRSEFELVLSSVLCNPWCSHCSHQNEIRAPQPAESSPVRRPCAATLQDAPFFCGPSRSREGFAGPGQDVRHRLPGPYCVPARAKCAPGVHGLVTRRLSCELRRASVFPARNCCGGIGWGVRRTAWPWAQAGSAGADPSPPGVRNFLVSASALRLPFHPGPSPRMASCSQ